MKFFYFSLLFLFSPLLIISQVSFYGNVYDKSSKETLIGANIFVDNKFITSTDFNGEYELTGLIGNITIKENEPFVHIHTTISDEDCNAFGGHLFSAVVTATCEIMLTLMKKTINRVECNEVGLYLWDFE